MGAASLSLFGGVTAANAAPGDTSNATGTFLGGSILSLIDLDAIAEIEGAAASNDGTEPTVVDYNTLDLTALGVVNVTVPGGIQVPVNLGSLGVVGQYAEADPDGGSVGASGAVGSGGVIGTGAPATGPLSVSLGGAVDALAGSVAADLVAELADVDLTLDAVSARASLQATEDGDPELVRDYTIAGGQLVIDSATLSDLTADLNAAVAGAQGTVDNVDTGLNSTLATLLGPLGGLVTANLSVSTTSLTEAVGGLLQGQLTSSEYPGVIIDLSTGEIIVDLDAIQPLNGLAPGTNILGSETVGEVGDAVAALVGGLVDDVNEALVAAVRGLSVTGGATVRLGIANINVLTVNTTVGALLDGDTAGVALLGIGLGLGGGVQGLVDGLTTPLETLLTNLGATVGAVAAPVTTLLTPALDEILPELVTVTVNNQSEPAPGVFSETGVIVTILPGSIATTIELANATVGPNALDDNADVTIVSPEDGAEFIVPDADDVSDVTITGTGEPGAEITVSIDGQEDQVTTVGEGGTWTVTFPDLPVGEYTATATQDADGTTADVTFAVVEAPDVAILTPTPDQIFVVPGVDDTVDVTVTGTGSPGSDVEVEVGGETQTVTVTPEGTWTATFEDLPIGDYTVTVTQEIDGSTDSVDFSIAETPDVVIEEPADGTEIAVGAEDGVTTVTVSGTGSPGSTVTVVLDNGDTETDLVDEDGSWSVDFTDLPIGDYTATATQDADGSTDTVDFSVVLATPVTITAPVDGTDYEVGEPDATRSVTVSGSGQAGAEIEVTLSNGDVETTTVLPSGLWSVTFTDVGVGEFTATAVQDIDDSSDTVSFSISAQAADADAADVDVADADLVDADADADVVDADAADVDALDVLDLDVTDVLDAADLDGDADVLDADADVADIDADADGLDVVDADALDIDILDADADVLDIDADGADGDVADADAADADALDVLDLDVTDVLDVLDIDADADVLDADGDVADIDADADGLDVVDADALDIDILDADADVLDIDADGADGDVADADAADADALDVLDLDVTDVLDVLDIDADADVLDADGDVADIDADADGLDLDLIDADALDIDILDADADVLDIDADGADGDVADADAADADALDVLDLDVTDVLDVLDIDADADVLDADADVADIDADADGLDVIDADALDIDILDADADVLDIDADGADADVADADVVDADVLDADVADIDADADVVDADVLDADVADIDADADVVDADVLDADVADIDADADVVDADVLDADVADIDADADVTDADAIDTDALDIADAIDQLDIADAIDQLDIADAIDQLDIADAIDQLDIADAIDQLDIADAIDEALDQLDIDADGMDADAVDADADATDTDADAGDADAGDADATDGIDADAGDADATDADAADADAVDGGATDADAADAVDADGVDADATDADATDGGVTSQARADVTLKQIVRGAGVTQTVTFSGFQPGETISATVNSTPFDLTPVTADASGSARMTFAVGADFELGAHRVEVRGSVTGELPTDRENTDFTVTAKKAATGAGGLPATGSDLNGPLVGGFAAALILAGATLWTLRRRSASGEQR